MMALRVLGVLLAIWSVPVHGTCQTGGEVIRRNTLTCGNKQYIVDIHNKIRNFVAAGRINGQPKAANMVEMRWNEELAKLAQTRSDRCLFEHGDLELDGNRVGQNLAMITSSVDNLRLNITQMILLWYEEVFQFGYDGGFDPNSGHYSQLIWGDSREVGCGFTYYKEDGWYRMYFVCDYYPPGNYINKKPYAYGKSDCKKYGLLESRKYSKLCAIDKSEDTVCRQDMALNETSTVAKNETKMIDNEVLMMSQMIIEKMNMTDDNSTIISDEDNDGVNEQTMIMNDDRNMEVIVDILPGENITSSDGDMIQDRFNVVKPFNDTTTTTTEFSEFNNEIETASEESPQRNNIFLKVIGVILISDGNSKYHKNNGPMVSFIGAPDRISTEPVKNETSDESNKDNVKFLSKLIELITQGVTII